MYRHNDHLIFARVADYFVVPFQNRWVNPARSFSSRTMVPQRSAKAARDGSSGLCIMGVRSRSPIAVRWRAAVPSPVPA